MLGSGGSRFAPMGAARRTVSVSVGVLWCEDGGAGEDDGEIATTSNLMKLLLTVQEVKRDARK